MTGHHTLQITVERDDGKDAQAPPATTLPAATEAAPAAPDTADEAKVKWVEAVDGIAKWATTGFALVAAVLAFFGIKDGAADLLIRTYPNETVAVFMFIGAAVLLGVVSPALPAGLDSKGHIRRDTKAAWLGVSGAIVMFAIGLWGLIRIDHGLVYLGLGVLASAAAILLRKKSMGWRPFAAGLAVICLMSGTLMAVELSVAGKLREQALQVGASFDGDSTAMSVTVTVKGGKLEDDKVLVLISHRAPKPPVPDVVGAARPTTPSDATTTTVPAGTGGSGQVDASQYNLISSYYLYPDSEGKVESSVTMPLTDLTAGEILISTATCAASGPTCVVKMGSGTQVLLRLPTAESIESTTTTASN